MSSAAETSRTVKTTKTVTSSSNGKGSTSTTDANASATASGRSESSYFYSKRSPITSVKTVVINRSLPGSASSSSYTRDSVDSVQSYRTQRSYGAISGELQQTSAGLSNMLTGREKERKEMQELNERFASYIEKVRFLEAQNRKLSEELLKLRESWGKETEKVKSLYETELAQLRKLLEDADQYKATMEVRVTSLEDQLNEMQILLDEANRLHSNDRETIDKLNQQMADYDSEISLLRRRCAGFDDEKARDQAEIKRLKQDLQRLRGDLDTETLNHINAENSAQSLREEIEFLKALHDSELKELAALAYRDTTTENREFWKNEMAQALHDIQREYDSKLGVVRGEMESQYSIKVQEARTTRTRDNMELTHLKEENRRIKAQVGDARNRIPELEARNSQLEREIEELRREMEESSRTSELEKNQLRAELSSCNATLAEYLKEMQTLMDAKLSLELEIHAYRKLLEGEEVRINQTSISREGSRTTTVIEQQTTSSSSEMSQQQIEQQQQQEMQQQGAAGPGVTVTASPEYAVVVVGNRDKVSRTLEEKIWRPESGEAGVPCELFKSERVSNEDWRAILELLCDGNKKKIVLVFNERPADVNLVLRAMKLISSTDLRVYVVDKTAQMSADPRGILQHPRVRAIFQQVVELTSADDVDQRLSDLASAVRNCAPPIDDSRKFDSTGGAFAWNFAFTFLRLVVPNLVTRFREDFYENGQLNRLIEKNFHVQPENIVVVEKYFVFVPDSLGQAVNPEELFPGCEKVELLMFNGLGFQRKVFIYLMKLENPTAGKTHALIFGDWASPIFAIQNMDLGQQQRQDADEIRRKRFQQFKEDLKLILNHPLFPELLFGEPDTSPERVQLVEATVAADLRAHLENEVEGYEKPQVVIPEFLKPKKSVQCDRSCLLVKLGSSLNCESNQAVRSVLDRQFKEECKLLDAANQATPVDKKKITEYFNQYSRILLILGSQDLKPNNRSNDHVIQLAAEKMKDRKECCVSVILVGVSGSQDELHQRLPDALKHLPYCCVEAVPNLQDPNHGTQVGDSLQEQQSDASTLANSLQRLRLTDDNCLKIEDVFPLPSMAKVLTAKICCGFADKMQNYLSKYSRPQAGVPPAEGSLAIDDSETRPFDGPYCFVLPTSKRFPDKAELHEQLTANNAEVEDKHFIAENLRPYNYQVWEWKSKRLAFEIPNQLSYLPEQLQWGFAGLVSEKQLDKMLTEFFESLRAYCRHLRNVKFVEWNDGPGFDGEPSESQERLAGELLETLRNQ